MNKRTLLAGLTLAVSLAVSSPLHAQTLETGTWTGIAVGPDGTSNYVTFEVKGSLDVRYVWSPDGRSVRPDGGIVYHSRQGSIQLEDIELPGMAIQIATQRYFGSNLTRPNSCLRGLILDR